MNSIKKLFEGYNFRDFLVANLGVIFIAFIVIGLIKGMGW